MVPADDGAAQQRAGHAPLRICVDARVDPGSGGVQQVVIGLAAGLAELGGAEEYRFLVRRGEGDWLAPYLGPNARLLGRDRPPGEQLRRLVTKAGNALARLGDDRAWRRPGLAPPRRSDGAAERSGCALVHFPHQSAFLTRLPSLYHPHDLQHLHLPELFSERERIRRERNYRLFCARAAFVPVASTWVKEDLVRQYGLPPGKVVVIPLAPSTAAYPVSTAGDLERLRQRLELPQGFLFYPAQPWPHKNHARLVEALARLRGEGLAIPLVCSGHLNEHFPALERRVAELGMAGQVRFLGFVTPAEVQGLYQLATAMVFPSLFEAPGLPIAEAMRAGLPLACSDATSMPRQVGDAALVFAARDPASIAAAVRRLWTEPELREQLRERGRLRVAGYGCRDAARRFRALYRRVAGRETAEDRALLAEEPLL